MPSKERVVDMQFITKWCEYKLTKFQEQPFVLTQTFKRLISEFQQSGVLCLTKCEGWTLSPPISNNENMVLSTLIMIPIAPSQSEYAFKIQQDILTKAYLQLSN